ncbi:OprD family outer membrane porin [Marivirga arenosa]|uniref:OprD family outer membrane porin n=1 Tax=Marivirga arenosa TaxID=3059076 RepID=A0AA51ZX77_9BACT|nr:OprD family outer membrane porin [Marivirga sp. BKB1-2]WNB18371.1 OprD family outer membrane porin [Marivirga sp. BKB1-2]
MKKYSYIIAFFILSTAALAQNNHQQYEGIDSVKHGSFNPNEAHSFHEWFKNGHVSGLFRSNTIQTFRPSSNSFHAASGLGGRIYYHSAYWHGLQVGVGGIYTYNILSTDLSETADHEFNPKWEHQLFDLEDPQNKHDLDRLEELFIKYRFKDSYIKFGKMVLNTPLVNPQDSRMKPSAFQGLWLDWNEGHKFEINGGFLNKVSPRSTTEWISMSESIGLYDRLLGDDTTHREVHTKGLALLGGHYIPNEHISFHSWQYYIENVSFITFNQLEFDVRDLNFGLQYYYQSTTHENEYTDIDHTNHTISARAKWVGDRLQISYNHTQSLSDNGIIFPSEWGGEPFYTTISRHRIIGLENVNSKALKLDLQPFDNWKSLNIGIYGVNSSFNNSNEESSLTQLSFDMQTQFRGEWSDLRLRLLNSYFIPKGYQEEHFHYESIFHSQLILNYRF